MASYCKSVMGNPGDETLAEISIMNPSDVAAMNSTFIVDGEEDTVKPDQDHDYVLREDMLMLRAQVMSLEAAL